MSTVKMFVKNWTCHIILQVMINHASLCGTFRRILSRKEIHRLFCNPTILRSIPYQMLLTCRQINEYRDWMESRRRTAPPHFVKQMIVRKYAKRFRLRVFVETGTYRGDMIEAVQDIFDEIFSIELGLELCEKAKRRFLGRKHISILQGNSKDVLPMVLARVRSPCLFWLDAHWSEGITAKGNTNTPILEELQHICRRSVPEDVILIDDARCFTGRDGYPTIEEIKDLVSDLHRTFEVKDDIIRIC